MNDDRWPAIKKALTSDSAKVRAAAKVARNWRLRKRLPRITKLAHELGLIDD